jgi:DNA/RNA endonuclease YhcR with UshA esterase domain
MARRLIVWSMVAVCGVPVAYAHHSFAAAYRENEKVTIEGEVVQLAYRNPHSFLQVDVKDEQGNVQRWTAEWGAATQLTQQNVTRDMLKPGDRVIVVANPSRERKDFRLRTLSVTRPQDGWRWEGTFD